MKVIDYIRRNPLCFDGATDQFDFDASPLIEGTTVFEISEIASQMIESQTERPGGGWATKFTPTGLEWLKHESGQRSVAFEQYVGIIPPFDNCIFEYQNLDGTGSQSAVHLYSLTKEQIAERFPDDGFAFVMYATVFYRLVVDGVSVVGRETTGIIASDENGRLTAFNLTACVPSTEDLSLPQNQPQRTPIFVTLVALMLMHCDVVKKTLSPDIAKSRQQRRWEEQHPSRVQLPLVRYYTLSLDTDRIQHAADSGKGGWEVAWHMVRAFLRRLPSGKVVPVRSHSRGNPRKGVIVKDYAVKAPSPKVA